MNNNNFFKKYLITIIIIALFAIAIIFGFYQIINKYNIKQEKNENNYIDNLDLDLPMKNKFKEKIKIDEIRKSQEHGLGILKKRNLEIQENQKICDDFCLKIKEIQNQFPLLKTQQTNLQEKHDNKVQEINQIKLQLQNKKSQLQTQGLSTYNNSEIKQLQVKIDELETERDEIMEQIAQVSAQIRNLESSQKSLTTQLGRAEKFKNELIQSHDELSEEFKNLTISTLQSYYDITSAEG